MNYITLLLPIFLFLEITHGNDEWQLDLVQILFRNGVSSPESLYPNDPNSPDVWEEGLEQLTLSGQKQLYAIGKVLKERYEDFLSSNPHELTVQSTYLDKCMNSALCLLASLYEPDKNWEFIPGLKWQPIPVHYEPPHRDQLLQPISGVGNISKEYSPVVDRILNNYKLKANHTVSDWAGNYWKDLQTLKNVIHNIIFKQTRTLKDIGGPLLVQMVQNFIAKSQDQLKENKIVIYSGQSFHLSGVLGALKYLPSKEPPFAAALVLEMFKQRQQSNETNNFGIRINYFNNIDAGYKVGLPETLLLPGCTEICPLEVLEKQAKQWRKEPTFRLFDSSEL